MTQIVAGEFWQSFETLRAAYRRLEQAHDAYRDAPSLQAEAAWKGAIANLNYAKVRFAEAERRYVDEEIAVH